MQTGTAQGDLHGLSIKFFHREAMQLRGIPAPPAPSPWGMYTAAAPG